ncbi:DsrE/DsrF-like family protein [Pustulibacterium marinum]|uniref:DsrE/DsrF-like family protein n=1 Tax=Pustulibacterium marinum TaxID=1224947 RepID=A0A1I7I2A6_9FLAO|nr:DsrE family protein [Pustulibacterium marinum]SFU67057.1 DsrE/DsrF-like family protein [Pustulibacterium marinum]
MKKLVLITLFVCLGCVSHAFAQQTETHNYVVITRNIQQLHPILLAAQQLATKHGSSMGNYEVIVCGKAVQELTDANKMAPLLEMAEQQQVTLLACGLSLHKFKIDTSAVVKGITVIENGLLYTFTKQEEGYKSITL